MSGHLLQVTWDLSMPSYELVCKEGPEAICRAEWDCDCEVFGESGVDERGPWHETYAWEGGDPTARHYGQPGGECNKVLCLNNADCVDELGQGTASIPVDLTWRDEAYEWTVVEGGVS
jgi:hypothetical protein